MGMRCELVGRPGSFTPWTPDRRAASGLNGAWIGDQFSPARRLESW